MIESKIVTFKNSSNDNIVAVHDSDTSYKKTRPFIIIPPAFGETKTDSLSLSYFLAMNGFNVLRYDGTHHTGESDGDIFHFTLDQGKNDLVSALDYVQRKFGVNKCGVVAKSLSWRYSLRVAVQDGRIKFLLGIGGIVNLQGTIKAVYLDDIVKAVKNKEYKEWKISDIFGYEISIEFLRSAIRDHFHNLKSTKDDMNKLMVPSTYLYAENDVWINEKNVKYLFGRKDSGVDLVVIKKALHQIDENPLAALFVFKQVTVSCIKYLLGDKIDHDDMIKPDVRKVAAQNRLEKARLRHRDLTKDEETKFWKNYLASYAFINKIPDFRDYMESIVKLFRDISREEVLLDAGCGPGFFGTWLIGTIKEHTPRDFFKRFQRLVIQILILQICHMFVGTWTLLKIFREAFIYVSGTIHLTRYVAA
jgi:hypothetical protein